MNRKAQGALEYLLLIGGAVLIAAIVLVLLTGIGQQGTGTAQTRAGAAQCEPLTEDRCETAAWGDIDSDGVVDCAWDATATACGLAGE